MLAGMHWLLFRIRMRTQVAFRQQLARVVPLDFKAAELFLHADSITDLGRAHACAKEPATVAWITERIKSGDVLYDIGANVGAYSLVAAYCGGAKARIYAFEPSFLNFHQLCRNVILNKFQGNILPYMIALSEKTGMSRFNYASLEPGAALHALGEAVNSKGESFEPIYGQQMISFCLDDLIEQFAFPCPNLVKMDVDGIEPSILVGADKTLGDLRLRSVIVEICDHRGQQAEIVVRMERHGFRLTATVPHKHDGIADLLFDR